MIFDQAKSELLFEEASRKVRLTTRQSPESIARLSRRRLSGNPLDVDALNALAAFSLRNRDPQQSLRVLVQNPSGLEANATGHRIAGYACLAQNQLDAASQHFDQSVRCNPCQSDCWTMLGRIHEDTGQREWAIAYYKRAILFDDPQHESALALSRLHARNKNLKEAIHTLRVSILRDRRSARLNIALARLLKRRAARLGRRRKRRAQVAFLEEACRCYKTANSSAPTSQTLISQGILEKRLDRFEDAKKSFQRAVGLDPNSALAKTHLANANVESGEIDQAIEQFRKAIHIDPRQGAAHFRYSRAKKFQAGEETRTYVAQLAGLASDRDLPRSVQVQVNFALAKVLDDLGDYDRAWQHYDRANRLKPGHSSSKSKRVRCRDVDKWNGRPLQRVADNAIRFFTPEFFESRRHLGNPSRTPVFIVGMPRSGTTLTEQILSSHPLIAGAGELKLMDRIRQEIVSVDKQAVGTSAAYPDLLSLMDPSRLRALSDPYLHSLDSYRTKELRVTDKMPTNFMHLGLIALLFPAATIIHCRRNPMDVLVSCYCQNLNAPFCDLELLTQYHHQYRRMMAHWADVLPLKIHTVDYESLVADPESNSRKLVEHCGLSWDDSCLQFHRNSRAVHTPSKWQVRQPMYRSSVEKWRRFEPYLQHIAREFENVDTISGHDPRLV